MDELWPGMFGKPAMDSIARHLPTDVDIEVIRTELLLLGDRIRTIIDATPSSFDRGPDDLTLSKRARELQQQVLNPAQTLRRSLLADPMFATYPEKYPSAPTTDDRHALADKIAELELFANDLRNDLLARAEARNLSHNIEMRFEFVFWIAEVIHKHTNLNIARSYTTVSIGDAIGNASPFFAAVQLAYVEITQETNPQLDGHFRDLVKAGL